jgi:hypothetical protein
LQRSYKNALLGTGSLGGFVLWVLDTVGRAQAAASMYDLISTPIAGVKINWPPIYLLMGLGCTAALLAINWDLGVKWWRGRAAATQFRWNMSLQDAALYVAFSSYFGEALGEPDFGKRIELALAAVWQAASENKIVLGANWEGGVNPKPIARRAYRELLLNYKINSGPRYGYGEPVFEHLNVVKAAHKEKIVFDKVFAERYALEETWPEKPDRI